MTLQHLETSSPKPQKQALRNKSEIWSKVQKLNVERLNLKLSVLLYFFDSIHIFSTDMLLPAGAVQQKNFSHETSPNSTL